MKFGSLFAGIGGFDLGLERAGIECTWQVEIDDYCQRVLQKHWPNVARYSDVRLCGKSNLESVDLICGGFPCQDISNAGKRAGIDGGRSGLWSEYARIICELRPRYVLVENVSALLTRGFDRVLGDLAACGYDAEWEVFSACAFGAPHPRERVFIVAYSTSLGFVRERVFSSRDGEAERTWRTEAVRRQNGLVATVGHPTGQRSWNGGGYNQPKILRVADGLSAELDELHGLGNAVVPQLAEWIGRRILEFEAARCAA